jgi:glycosyltransferase involved in cell wall biosynthesis
MKVAVAATMLNEAAPIGALLDALAAQTRVPDEIVLVDGGSTDGTVAVVERYRTRLPILRLIEAPGSNIARGRNIGIAAVTSEIVALTDAGCVPEPDWLERLTAPFGGDPEVGIVQGRSVADPRNHVEACIGACSLAFALPLGGATVFPTARGLAFRRDLWAAASGFPEHLAFGEDTAFIVRAVARHGRLDAAPDAVVRWRPRRSYREVVRQFYRYADGIVAAGLSGRIHRATVTQSVGCLGLAALGLAARHWLPWVALAGLGAAYVARKARQGCFDVPSWRTYYRVPLVLLAIHVGTMAGILHGHGRRLLGRRGHADPAR